MADDVALDAMAANERMGAALAYIYREAPEWKQRVADHLADYPFTFGTDGSVPSHEEAIRALKIMDAFNRLALRYPVLEVLDAAKKWVAYIDSQAQKFAEEARTDG